jgi:hypothetical protein
MLNKQKPPVPTPMIPNRVSIFGQRFMKPQVGLEPQPEREHEPELPLRQEVEAQPERAQEWELLLEQEAATSQQVRQHASFRQRGYRKTQNLLYPGSVFCNVGPRQSVFIGLSHSAQNLRERKPGTWICIPAFRHQIPWVHWDCGYFFQPIALLCHSQSLVGRTRYTSALKSDRGSKDLIQEHVVGANINRFLAVLSIISEFRRHETDRVGAARHRKRRSDRPRQTKHRNSRLARSFQENICWIEIAMHDSHTVQI